MMKKLFMTLAILTLVMQPAFAFTLSSADQSISTCPSNTGLFVAQVANSGSSTEIFTLGVSGAASGWASVAPAGFALGPGQSQDVYVYVTPSSNAQAGNYPLTLTVSSGSSSQNLVFNYNVESCYDISLTTQVNELSVCSGSPASYTLNLRNDGQWEDTFDLAVSGEAGPWSSLSRTSVSLVPGESEQVSVLVTPPRNNVGVYSLAAAATSQSASVVAQSLTINSRSCYEFDMISSENYVSFCDNSEAKVPVTITNSGSENNVYSLDLEGTGWSVLDRDSLSIPAGSSATFNLILTPGFNDVGTSVFNIDAEAATGDTSDAVTINANVLTCRDTSLDIESSSIELCSGTSETVDVMLTNAGQFQESYSLTVDGPSWAKLDRNSVILASGESATMKLSLTPETNVGLIHEDVTINARSQNVGNTQDSDSIRVTVPVRAACYNVDLETEHSAVTVAYGEGALVPIIVKNTGSQSNIYEFTVSGEGSQFAQINPGAIEVEGNSVEETYLYISIPRDAAKNSYSISVAAHSGELRDSTAVILTISDEEPKFVGATPETSSEGSGAGASIWSGIVSLYSVTSNFVINYWYVFPALLALLVVLYGLGRVRDSESWMKDLELLEQELDVSEKKEKPKPKKTQPSLLKRFSDWLMEEDEVKIITKSKPKVKSETKVKKEPGMLQRFSDWLMEEDEPKAKAKTKPKAKKEPGRLQRLSEWLMEEDEKVEITRKPGKPLLEQAKEFLFEEVPVVEEKAKPKKKVVKKDGLWKKFIDWLEEEDEPKSKSKPKLKKVAPKKTQPSLLKRFSDWLMEEDEPKVKSQVKPKSKPNKKEKGIWQKFIDWLEEED